MLMKCGYTGRQLSVRRMTATEVKNLQSGSEVRFLANDGTVRRLKINGKVRTWKRDLNRVEVPIKYGLYEFGTLNLEEACDRFLVILSEVRPEKGRFNGRGFQIS